jgi:hypothetical protein
VFRTKTVKKQTVTKHVTYSVDNFLTGDSSERKTEQVFDSLLLPSHSETLRTSQITVLRIDPCTMYLYDVHLQSAQELVIISRNRLTR